MRVPAHRLATGLVSAGLAAAALSPAAAGAQTPPTTATAPAPPAAAVVPDTAPTTTPAPASTTAGAAIDPTSPLDLSEPEQPHAVEDPSMPRTPPAKPSKPKAAEPAPEPAPGSQANGSAGTAAPTTAGPGDAALAAIPAGAQAGVPSYFIDSFRIPVFLLPIYQAAGTEYGVRWEILAAINEIETDYGRNLNVSTAGATGWMQFMPATWAGYGVDANRDGRADPYNPVDAIFAAARYLQAAGAQTDLPGAIFAYNHAGWYVSSVLDRAQRLAALPADLVAALTGLANGRSPALGRTRTVAGHAKGSRTLKLSVTDRARIVAVSDARVVRVGRSARLGRFIQLRDLFGNTYTYGRLSNIARRFPVLRPAPAATPSARAAGPQQDPAPTMPATAGSQAATPAVAVAPTAAPAAGPPAASAIEQPAAAAPAPQAAPLAERTLDDRAAAGLRAWPAARVAGPLPVLDWAAQARRMGIGVPVAAPARPRPAAPSGPSLYDRRLLGSVAASRVLYRPLREGSRVVAGTILGHAKRSSRARLSFEIRPAGRSSARIDPAPIVAGWKLLQASSRGATGLGTTSQPSVGQVMLLAKDALQRLVLANPRIAIYPCGREDIAAGRIDRRVLATLQMLAMSGLSPTVSALQCGHGRLTSAGRVSEHSSGNAVDVSAVNGTPILGNQGPGSITDTAIRRLLTLQGAMQPHQIISLMTYAGATNTLALADHADHIHVGFSPLQAPGSPAARLFDGVLEPKAWQRLVDRLAAIDNPRVATGPSAAATLATPTTP